MRMDKDAAVIQFELEYPVHYDSFHLSLGWSYQLRSQEWSNNTSTCPCRVGPQLKAYQQGCLGVGVYCSRFLITSHLIYTVPASPDCM